MYDNWYMYDVADRTDNAALDAIFRQMAKIRGQLHCYPGLQVFPSWRVFSIVFIGVMLLMLCAHPACSDVTVRSLTSNEIAACSRASYTRRYAACAYAHPLFDLELLNGFDRFIYFQYMYILAAFMWSSGQLPILSAELQCFQSVISSIQWTSVSEHVTLYGKICI